MKGRKVLVPASVWQGFTILELLVATTVLLVVMVILLQLTGGLGQVWKSGSGKISAYQNARSAFATLNRTLAQATLNTYSDYVNSSGAPRTTNNAATFSPDKFMRASELHFLAGPTDQLLPGASAAKNPGDAIFFQAPLGDTDANSLAPLSRAMNSTAFFIQYGAPDSDILPNWLKPTSSDVKRFRLMQVVVPTESLQIYNSTADATYDLNWLSAFKTPRSSAQPTVRVLAEDIPLLIFRLRLSPQDEKTSASSLGAVYSDATRGSVLSPKYHYDSRAWEPSYPNGQRVLAGAGGAARASLMRNQVPPIADVVMISVDRRSLSRFDQASDNPPTQLQVPAGLFTDSAKLDADLTAYGKQLSDAGILYRVFRTSVEIQGAKWSNN
jgi:uncharacterized protein (TIGR02599 family)